MNSFDCKYQLMANIFGEIYGELVSLWMKNGGTNFQALLKSAINHIDQRARNYFKNICLEKVTEVEYILSFDIEEDGKIFRCYGTFQFQLNAWWGAKVKSSFCRWLMSVGYYFDRRGELLMNNGQVEFSSYAVIIALLDCRKMHCRVSMCYEYLEADSTNKLIRKATQDFGQIVFAAYPLFACAEKDVADRIIPAVIEAQNMMEGKFLDMAFLIRHVADCKVDGVTVPIELELSCGKIVYPRILIEHSEEGIDMKIDWL